MSLSFDLVTRGRAFFSSSFFFVFPFSPFCLLRLDYFSTRLHVVVVVIVAATATATAAVAAAAVPFALGSLVLALG